MGIKEILKDLKEFSDEGATEYGYEMPLSEVREVIKALERTRWIPVSERLPELEDTNGEYEVIGYESNFKIVSTQHYVDFEMNKKLTHWMPLPNPPEVE